MTDPASGGATLVFKIIDPGHSYQLLGELSAQELNFIKKEDDGQGHLKLVQDGTTNEALIAVLINRLEVLDEKLASPFNSEAISHLRLTLEALSKRTRDRLDRGVEGSSAV